MNLTEDSMKRIYAYLATTAPARQMVTYSPQVMVSDGLVNDWCAASETDCSLLMGSFLEGQESQRYQKCLSRLTVEILPPIITQSAAHSGYGRMALHQN